MIGAAAKIGLNHRQEVADASGGSRLLATQKQPVECLEAPTIPFSSV